MPEISNRKITKKPQVAHIVYREVLSKGETYLPCLSGHSDAELIKLTRDILKLPEEKNLEFEIRRK